MLNKCFLISLSLSLLLCAFCFAESGSNKQKDTKISAVRKRILELNRSIGTYVKTLKKIDSRTSLNFHIRKSSSLDKDKYKIGDISQVVLYDKKNNTQTVVWWKSPRVERDPRFTDIKPLDVYINKDRNIVEVVYLQIGLVEASKFVRNEDGVWLDTDLLSLPVSENGVYPRYVTSAKFMNINTLRVQTKEGSIEHWDIGTKHAELLWWNGVESQDIGKRYLLNRKSDKYVESPEEPEYPEDDVK